MSSASRGHTDGNDASRCEMSDTSLCGLCLTPLCDLSVEPVLSLALDVVMPVCVSTVQVPVQVVLHGTHFCCAHTHRPSSSAMLCPGLTVRPSGTIALSTRTSTCARKRLPRAASPLDALGRTSSGLNSLLM
jgi:hypothetical protein